MRNHLYWRLAAQIADQQGWFWRLACSSGLPGLALGVDIRSSAACFIDATAGSGEARSRCPGCRSHIGCPPAAVWLSHGLRSPGTAGSGVAQEGIALLEAAVPSRPDHQSGSRSGGQRDEQLSERVVIGMDPHKRSVTIEVMTADETVARWRPVRHRRGRVRGDARVRVRRPGRTGSGRSRAATGSAGTSRMRLLADGEEVVDVPPKLSARARVFATGQGRKTDATDAHSVALVGTRMAGLRPVVADEQLAVLRLLADRRRALGEEHTRKVSQLHALLLELIPGGAKKDLSAAQAKALLAKVRPRDVAGKTRRRLAAELVADLERIYARKKAADKELRDAGRRDRHRPAGPARHRTLRRRPAAGRGRRHHPVPRPQPLRVLDRHRTHRRLLRRPRPPPALPRREPADQPSPAHHGHRPAAQPDRRPRLLRPQEGRREVLERSHALPQTHDCPTSSTAPCSTTPSPRISRRGRAREGNGATTLTPARPAHNPTPALRTSHFPDPPPPSLNPTPGCVLTQKGAMSG